MSRNAYVLGWAHAGANCVGGVTAVSPVAVDGNAINVLICKTNAAQCPRHRLQIQVNCFEAGIDFLPVAPATNLALSTAQAFTTSHAHELSDLLHRLKGAGQMTFGIEFPSERTPDAPAETGRAWLQQRRAHQTATEAHLAHTIALLDQLDIKGFETKTRATGTRVERDILVPRDCFKYVIERLRRTADGIEDAPFPLMVTGLWPPFSFAQPFCDTSPSWD